MLMLQGCARNQGQVAEQAPEAVEEQTLPAAEPAPVATPVVQPVAPVVALPELFPFIAALPEYTFSGLIDGETEISLILRKADSQQLKGHLMYVNAGYGALPVRATYHADDTLLIEVLKDGRLNEQMRLAWQPETGSWTGNWQLAGEVAGKPVALQPDLPLGNLPGAHLLTAALAGGAFVFEATDTGVGTGIGENSPVYAWQLCDNQLLEVSERSEHIDFNSDLYINNTFNLAPEEVFATSYSHMLYEQNYWGREGTQYGVKPAIFSRADSSVFFRLPQRDFLLAFFGDTLRLGELRDGDINWYKKQHKPLLGAFVPLFSAPYVSAYEYNSGHRVTVSAPQNLEKAKKQLETLASSFALKAHGDTAALWQLPELRGVSSRVEAGDLTSRLYLHLLDGNLVISSGFTSRKAADRMVRHLKRNKLLPEAYSLYFDIADSYNFREVPLDESMF